jgi:hypothetical protein
MFDCHALGVDALKGPAATGRLDRAAERLSLTLPTRHDSIQLREVKVLTIEGSQLCVL